jgi:Domain of unknown function (DUF4287)
MSDRVTGPASHFPSIEKKYGQPIGYWYAELEPHQDLAHMEMVRFLKTEHGMGHGHANAIVGVFRAKHGL